MQRAVGYVGSSVIGAQILLEPCTRILLVCWRLMNLIKLLLRLESWIWELLLLSIYIIYYVTLVASLHWRVQLTISKLSALIILLFELLLLLEVFDLLLPRLQIMCCLLRFGSPVHILLGLIWLNLLRILFTRNSLRDCLLLCNLSFDFILVRFFTWDDHRICWTLWVDWLIIWAIYKIIDKFHAFKWLWNLP